VCRRQDADIVRSDNQRHEDSHLLDKIPVLMQLTPMQSLIVVSAVFVAGLVRGFSGFALSALIMSSVILILPPVQLIPVCYVLEGVASLTMLRGGMRDANMKIVWGLAIGSAIGVPLGLYATTTLPVEQSRMIALALILTLAAAQLLRVNAEFMRRPTFLYIAGITAGITTGLAHVGGMVVALYVLATDTPVKTMRASLVMFLFIGMFTSLVYQLGFGVLDKVALTRGAVLAPVVVAGVLLGSALFRPALEGAYKRFCLGLLILLALNGLLQVLV
jgi:uncharacterized membrane protein YfcA